MPKPEKTPIDGLVTLRQCTRYFDPTPHFSQLTQWSREGRFPGFFYVNGERVCRESDVREFFADPPGWVKRNQERLDAEKVAHESEGEAA